MGNIKTTYIKHSAKDILNKFEDRFTSDFGENKKVLGEVAQIKSVFVRNRVAGYITRLKRSKRSKRL